MTTGDAEHLDDPWARGVDEDEPSAPIVAEKFHAASKRLARLYNDLAAMYADKGLMESARTYAERAKGYERWTNE